MEKTAEEVARAGTTRLTEAEAWTAWLKAEAAWVAEWAARKAEAARAAARETAEAVANMKTTKEQRDDARQAIELAKNIDGDLLELKTHHFKNSKALVWYLNDKICAEVAGDALSGLDVVCVARLIAKAVNLLPHLLEDLEEAIASKGTKP